MDRLWSLPSSVGVYVLHLTVASPQCITIGRLGRYNLPASHYFYVGSARGAGGLRARVGRHLRGDGARHWHIDYLRSSAEVQNVFYTVTDSPLECAWSQALARLPQAVVPIPHFGSSDCRSGCAAHLIAFSSRINLADLQRILSQATHKPIVHLQSR